MSGISDVARHAGVSKSTASRALSGAGYVSEETRQRVVEAARALGYSPSTHAVSLSTGRTRTIGVIMPYATRWFFAEVLEGIQATLLTAGYDLTLYDAKPGTVERNQVFSDFLTRKRFDGLIAVGLEPADDEMANLEKLGCPIVAVAGNRDYARVVSIDDVRAAHRATHHLISLGHQKIVLLGAGATLPWAHVNRQRFRGYQEAMSAAGLEKYTTHITSEVTMQSGYAVAADLLADSDRPTAIVAVCDEVAVGAIIAARRLGIAVPSALSVIGIDNHEYAEMFSLTTIEQVPRDQGTLAARLVLEEVADPTASGPIEPLSARLIVRNSTASVDAVRTLVNGGSIRLT